MPKILDIYVAFSAIKNGPSKPFQGPVYDIDRDHHFQQLMVHAQELKNLHGPVYDVSKDHQVTTLVVERRQEKGRQTKGRWTKGR